MRNLKRALSLTLASVMLLGMMVVGSSALSFNDADDITNVTAASVLEDLGIMQGDGSGNFMPDRPVTRAQMAIIICRILYGNKLNVSQFEGTTQYTDVAATEYYTGYINLATQLGIIGGYGDGRFGPNDTVTTAQAALMLSRALGYFKGNEIAQAQDWALASVAQATKINMFGELKLATNAELARDNVAEMVFNTITATVPVQYNELLGVYYNENQGIIYALNFNYLETLGYKNFDLVYRDDTQDIYGRPARTWGTGTYNTRTNQGTGGTQAREDLDANGGLIASRVRMLDKDEIITVALTPDYVYTEGKDEDEVYKDLGRTLCNENTDPDKGYAWSAYVNGELVYSTESGAENAYYGYDRNHSGHNHNDIYVPTNNCTADYVMTGKGAQTEIYVDDGDSTVTVVEINYYLGEVTRVSDNTITVKTLSTEPARLNIRTANAAGYDVDDLVVFTVDLNDDDDFYICETFEPETAEGTIKRVESDNDSNDSYVRFEVGGDKYRYSGNGHMVYDLDDLNNAIHPDLEEDYTLYMDPNGYVLAYELTGDEDLNYLYVKDSDEEMTDWVAKVIYADATVAKVDVKKDLKDTDGNYAYDKVQWIKDSADYDKNDLSTIDGLVWKYSKNSSGTHTLTWARGEYLIDKDIPGSTSTIDVEIHNDRAYIGEGRGRVIVDQKTVFVDVENEKSYTGYEAVPNVKNAEIIYVLDRKGVADVVFILDGKISDDGFYFVLEGTDRESWLRGGKGGDRYWEYTKAYVDGLKENVFVDYTNAGGSKDNLKTGVLYKGTDVEEEDGVTYIEELEEVAIFDDVNKTEALTENWDEATDRQNMRVVATRRNGSFSLVGVDNQKELQYTSNADTVFVLVEETYKRDNKGNITHDGWNVSKGNINDLDTVDYAEKLNTYVTVVQDDGNELAEIVYILKTLTRYPVEITMGSVTRTYWAEMTKWDDATRTPVVSLDVYDADLVDVNIDTQKITGANGTLTLNNGRLTGDITINTNVSDGLIIEVTTTEPAPKPLENEATITIVDADGGFSTGAGTNGKGEAVTLKAGDNKVKGESTFTITLKSGYEIEGETPTEGYTYTFTAPADKGSMTITISRKAETGFKVKFSNADLYGTGSPDRTPAKIYKNLTTEMTVGVPGYELENGVNKVITMTSADRLTFSCATALTAQTSYIVTGTLADGTTYSKAVTANADKFIELPLADVDQDLTIAGIAVAYKLVVADGVTVGSFERDTSSDDASYADMTTDSTAKTTTYYFATSIPKTIKDVYADTASGVIIRNEDGALYSNTTGTNDDIAYAAKGSANKANVTMKSAAADYTKDLYLYPAAKITTTVDGTAAKANTVELDGDTISDGDYVVLGQKLDIAINATAPGTKGSAVIALDGDGTTVDASQTNVAGDTQYEVTKDVSFFDAWKLELNNVTATTANQTLNAGTWYIKDNVSLTAVNAVAGKGTEVITTPASGIVGTKYTAGAVAADTSLSAAIAVSWANSDGSSAIVAKINPYNAITGAGSANIASGAANANGVDTIYVLPNSTIVIAMKNTAKFVSVVTTEGGTKVELSNAADEVGVVTLGTVDVTIEEADTIQWTNPNP